MLSILSFLFILALSLLIIRIGTIALRMTGLAEETAKFQAVSAFSGAGFTTEEAERVVRHPVRRRIIRLLILLGSLGIVTAIGSLIISFTTAEGGQSLERLVVLLVGVGILWLLAMSKWVDRHLSRFIEWALNRWTDLDLRDYAGLLRLHGEYTVAEIEVEPDSWLAHHRLEELHLPEEGVIILGIVRKDGTYLGAPSGKTCIYPGDILIVYGQEYRLKELSERHVGARGDEAHAEAVREYQHIREKEAHRDTAETLSS